MEKKIYSNDDIAQVRKDFRRLRKLKKLSRKDVAERSWTLTERWVRWFEDGLGEPPLAKVCEAFSAIDETITIGQK